MLRIINTWFLFFLLAYRRINAFNIATPEASTTTPASTSEIIAIVFNPNENMRPDLPSPIRTVDWFKYLEKKVKSAAKAAINQQERKADLIKQIE
ncbi:unnamed protein product [Rhizophagus irregularis]|nr:unnamed protein product [Rhizophagus irregularis]